MSKTSPSPSERRTFLTGLNAGAVSLAAVTIGGVAMAQEKTAAAPARWEPARHEKDDWFEKLPGKHRSVFDATTADGLGEALAFTNNYMRISRADYGLQGSDLAVVVVTRHRATAFAYNDAMWAKYGAIMGARAKFEDPKSKQTPKINVYNSGDYGDLLANRGRTLDSLAKDGVQFAVCSLATRANATAIAAATGGTVDAIVAELTSNLVSNARMVPAGVIAVIRAQERGYALVSA